MAVAAVDLPAHLKFLIFVLLAGAALGTVAFAMRYTGQYNNKSLQDQIDDIKHSRN